MENYLYVLILSFDSGNNSFIESSWPDNAAKFCPSKSLIEFGISHSVEFIELSYLIILTIVALTGVFTK